MKANKKLPHLVPSGLNSKFWGATLSFYDYLSLMRKMILTCRTDINSETLGPIVLANSPFLWEQPTSAGQPKTGVLLIHGLFDSPFYMRDLGHYFFQQGFVVNGILLPGHGTVPGDLLNIDYREWVKAVLYGIQTLREKNVEQIYLVGYSIGGMLALHHVLNEDCSLIKALILFAPAIKPKRKIQNLLVHYAPLFCTLFPKLEWYQIRNDHYFTRYFSLSLNAAHQACQLIKVVTRTLKKMPLDIPLFITTSKDDETLSTQSTLDFFCRQQNAKNRLLLYSKQPRNYRDPRIITRSSHFPTQKIVDFSHTCLAISPENPFLGESSRYFDLHHYPEGQHADHTNCHMGAVSKKNLKKYTLSRLAYNPDFPHLL